MFIALPLAAAALMPLLGRLGRRLPETVASLVTAALLAMQIMLVIAFGAGTELSWNPACLKLPAGFGLRMDGLSWLFLVTISLVSLAASVYSIRYMEKWGKKQFYYALLMLTVAGMNGMVLTTDIFNMYLFLEVAAVAAYGLVAFGQKHEETEAAFKYLMLSVVATSGLLLAISFIFYLTGSLAFADLHKAISDGGNPQLVTLCVAFFLVAFSVKVGVVPFHGWLPDAYPSAPAPISALLSGILGKVTGIYALLRVLGSLYGDFNLVPPSISSILLALGVVSMLVGALLALGQSDFRRVLAYSSISQIGYVFLGFGCGTDLGMVAGLFHLFNHSIFKTLLFLSAGSTEYATGERDLNKLGGVADRMPVTGLSAIIGSLATAGVPPFNGFWSKLMIIMALVECGRTGLALLAIAASILTLWYLLLIQRRAFYGKLRAGLEKVQEAPFSMSVVVFALAVLCLLGGLMYPWVLDYIIAPAARALVGSVPLIY